MFKHSLEQPNCKGHSGCQIYQGKLVAKLSTADHKYIQAIEAAWAIVVVCTIT